ncbi:uncharacterized protein LOC109543680 [Dendroctonus ponderosae]|uniref:28S ribosomal protein S34, mitochondrial n=1 Tax=Dendroctonus ponderosae TaxID=77166 RepID=J3JTS2_DENPD|nr:uncharacterized protein LOC109543680 [Dendroctonus ponderosae]AEE61594.1 unknown [Dendroctonus ponderosae]ERL85892.1 hypothetical protein D910_03307 [Dendroctonus ponderosae]KAH1027363.1 hypothetical protein HUJ05_000890 [Dendroctonus ponderosae]
MPYKYIGRTHDFVGKSLWEIVGNLKNFGVGRFVARGKHQRYLEPSYMKILKVETLPRPEDESIDNLRKVRVLVEQTFRGKTVTKPVLIERVSYKTDYRLIPKDEEQTYCKFDQISVIPEKILPKYMDFPPIFKQLNIRESLNRGGPTKEDLQLEIVYNNSSKKMKYKIAEEGEEPTVKIATGVGQPVVPRLYASCERSIA